MRGLGAATQVTRILIGPSRWLRSLKAPLTPR
jgi:hypothetical protein